MGMVFGLLSAAVLLVFLVIDDFRANEQNAETVGYGCLTFVIIAVLCVLFFVVFANAL